MEMTKGWRSRWNGGEAYVSAETRSKARYRVFLSASDAGYPVKIQEIQVWRDRYFDGIKMPHALSYEGAKALRGEA